MTPTRRTFLISIAGAGGSLAVANSWAQAKLSETDPQAAALGYVADTSKVDARKYPKHDNTQVCSGCALWQAKPTDAQGGCALFAGKQVSARGWCSAWSRKA